MNNPTHFEREILVLIGIDAEEERLDDLAVIERKLYKAVPVTL